MYIKNSQKFTDFEGVVRFSIRQKVKSYSKKLKFLPIISHKTVSFVQNRGLLVGGFKRKGV